MEHATPALRADTSATVAEYVEDWLAKYGGPPYHSEHAKSVRAYNLRHYVLPRIGTLRLDELRPEHLVEVQCDLLARVSVSTARHVLQGSLAGVLRSLRRCGALPGNLFAGLVWPRDDTPEPDPFTEDEARKLLDYFRDERREWLPFAALVFLAGMRPSEAAGLTWADVDLATGRCRVIGGMVAGERTNGKTRKSRRTIDLDPDLLAIVRGARPAWAKPGDLIVSNRRGRPINTHTWGTYHFARACRSAGVRPRGFYHGRHHFISLAITRGANIAHVAAYCGTSVQYVEKNYLRWLGSMRSPLLGAARDGDVAHVA